jgi:nitroreductase
MPDLANIRLGERMASIMATRVSVPPRQLQAPGLSTHQFDHAFAAALATPSHGGLRNFRFVIIADDRRDALADIFEAAKHEENPHTDDDDVVRARDKAHHAPTLILVIARIYADHPDIPAIEQIASAA